MINLGTTPKTQRVHVTLQYIHGLQGMDMGTPWGELLGALSIYHIPTLNPKLYVGLRVQGLNSDTGGYIGFRVQGSGL